MPAMKPSPVLQRAAVVVAVATGALAAALPAAAAAPAVAVNDAAAAPGRNDSRNDGRDSDTTRVLEDSQVRIEESRLRGQTRAITVQSKLPGVKAYDIIMPPLGKDPSQDKGAAGKRTWSLFDF